MNFLFDISIIIPVYNCSDYIERSIRSALKNRLSAESIEIVVVNDGSTDSTSRILQKYEQEITIIDHERNMGLPSALNTGIFCSKGQFIVRLDADDYVLPDYCRILSTALKLNNQLDAVRCDYFLIDHLQETRQIRNSDEHPIGCGIMFRRQQLIKLGAYNPNFLINEDKELENRFCAQHTITRIPIPLYKYFIHGKNMTLNDG